ncbi:MAG: hypothetical protein ABI298_02465, partial [Acidimicrobiales bacterium]
SLGEREIVLTRESSASGRLRSAINGVSSSAEALRNLAVDLIVIHGQHDSLALRQRGEIVRLVDACGAVSTEELDQTRRALREARQRRTSLGGNEEEREHELDFMSFQIHELESVAITSTDELEETLEELTRLTALRDGQTALSEVLDLLDADTDTALLALFAQAISRLPTAEAYDAPRAMLRGALQQSREGVHELATFANLDAFDPSALKDLEDRATQLQQVARKYGGTLALALATLNDLRKKYQQQLDAASLSSELDGQIVDLQNRSEALARNARDARERAARSLTLAVAKQLPRVALNHATLRFDVDGEDGSQMQILFTANPGQNEGPLQSLASGGELSRVLLALSLETAHEDVVTVFDEVDAGIGGQVAQQIGECLREVSRNRQVLAVTHLASVAAKADHHFVIEKSITKGEVVTSARLLNGAERISEIARMLAGDEITSESRALAQQLLETSR